MIAIYHFKLPKQSRGEFILYPLCLCLIKILVAGLYLCHYLSYLHQTCIKGVSRPTNGLMLNLNYKFQMLEEVKVFGAG